MTTPYGLNANGFTLKRLPDIKTELENAFQLVFGNIDISADSVAGQLIGVLCKPVTDIWEQIENTYFSQYPDTADGVSLDYAVALTGITRKASSPSYGRVSFSGVPGTIIPAGTTLQTENTNIQFLTDDSVTIQNDAVVQLYISIDHAYDFTDYIITINGVSYTYNSGVSSTIYSIAQGLAGAISGIVNVRIINNVLYLSALGSPDFDMNNISAGAYTDAISWSTPATITAINNGAQNAPAGTITIIVSAVSGLDSVTNLEDITLGENIESDTDLRIRRLESLKITGGGSLESIRARILNLPLVLHALVYENDTDGYITEDGVSTVYPFGMPPHSMELVVDAPNTPEENTLIANELWLSKPAGIQLYGSQSITITDSQGFPRVIAFSHPYTRNVYLWITLTTNAFFPANGRTLVADAIKAYGNNLQIGDDFIFQEYYAPIYSIPGVSLVDIRVMVPKVEYLLPATPQIATLAALITALRTLPLGNNLLSDGDYFLALGSADVAASSPHNLTAIKGSTLAGGDVFRITSIAAATIIFIGSNLTSAGYVVPSSGFFAISAVEQAKVDQSRTSLM